MKSECDDIKLGKGVISSFELDEVLNTFQLVFLTRLRSFKVNVDDILGLGP